MNELVRLERVGLCEAHVAVLAFVGLFAGVRTQMPLQLEGVWRGVRAVRALYITT